ncbi:uncharacterized protein TNIN_416511 [Trichonephila inaurata madagascariensis]|uniref:Uncharacterized protein n=1 Tax=Trichonephila inaurata madagascariensis TaxID=2747483 RepID=A0A8X6X487_9ARAC|nr:uncharacterized protein TNIN_416511 [Trichonephila inaurata madagascariensis]
MAAGRIFDPLGLITPFTIRFKCLFQEIWQKKLAWDEELPPDISEAWEKWCAEIPQITNIRVPRYVLHFSEIEEVSVKSMHFPMPVLKLMVQLCT